MPQDLAPLATAALFGFLHALEVDHMLAVSVFVTDRPALRTAAGFGLRWGMGHGLTVMALGALAVVSGLRWPAHLDALAEGGVGLLLIGIGVWALRRAARLHLHRPQEHGDHLHLHSHGLGVHPHGHGAGHAAHRPHRHGRNVTAVGLLHGLAGTSGVVALVPLTVLERPWLGAAYLAVFGIGTVTAMTLFAVIAAAAARRMGNRSVAVGRAIGMAVGGGAVFVGGWWIWRAAAAG